MADGALWVLCPGAAWRDKHCKCLLADNDCGAEALRRYCDQYRMQLVIPMRSMKRKPKPGLPRLLDRPKHLKRYIIERMSFDLVERALRRWVNQLQSERGGATPMSKALTSEHQKIQELEDRIKPLVRDKPTLEKATALLMVEEHERSCCTINYAMGNLSNYSVRCLNSLARATTRIAIILSSHVSRAEVDRCALLYNSLIKASESVGYKWAIDKGSFVWVDGEELLITIQERIKRLSSIYVVADWLGGTFSEASISNH